MSTVSSQNADWRLPFREFLLFNEAHRAHKTYLFYRCQLTQLINWAEEQEVGFGEFGKRQMDRYLAERKKTISPTTLHQDGVAARAFFRWCSRNDLLDRNPLADYEVRRAPGRKCTCPPSRT